MINYTMSMLMGLKRMFIFVILVGKSNVTT